MRNALLGIILCLFASAVNADDNFEAVKAQLIADNPTVDLSRMSYGNNILSFGVTQITSVSDISALSGLTALELLYLSDTLISDVSAIQHMIDSGLNIDQ